VLKHLEGRESPNLPVALVVSDCPAPHLFAKSYAPKKAVDDWDGALNKVEVSAAQRRLVETDLKVIQGSSKIRRRRRK